MSLFHYKLPDPPIASEMSEMHGASGSDTQDGGGTAHVAIVKKPVNATTRGGDRTKRNTKRKVKLKGAGIKKKKSQSKKKQSGAGAQKKRTVKKVAPKRRKPNF
jgi:hypothetical protein